MFKIITKLLPPSITRISTIGFAKAKVKAANKERINEIFSKALSNALNNRSALSVAEWKEFRSDFQKEITENEINLKHQDIIFLNSMKSLQPPHDSLQNAKNYVKAFDVEQNSGINAMMIDLYAKNKSEYGLSSLDENELLKLCDDLIADNLCLMFQINSNVVRGLCATKDWKRSVEVIQLAPCVSSLGVLINKSLQEHDGELAWRFLNQAVTEQLGNLHPSIFISYWKYCRKDRENLLANVEKMLKYIESNEINLSEDVVVELLNLLRESGYKCSTTFINEKSGICQTCKNSLDPMLISGDELTQLQTAFMEKVVKGDDIFQNTTPQEWSKFSNLVKQAGPFDVILDGLNIALAQTGNKNLLITAIEQFATENKRVMVIGREHMYKWPIMHYIKKNSVYFLASNVSKDDVFLLYAALLSGPNTYILSRDFMRCHKYKLGSGLDAVFKRWQQQHQLSFSFDDFGLLNVKHPWKYKMVCHQSRENKQPWHLPFFKNIECLQQNQDIFVMPENWACIQLESNEPN